MGVTGSCRVTHVQTVNTSLLSWFEFSVTILLLYIAISPNITKIIFSFRKVSYQWNYYRQICFGSTLAGGTVEHTDNVRSGAEMCQWLRGVITIKISRVILDIKPADTRPDHNLSFREQGRRIRRQANWISNRGLETNRISEKTLLL